MFHNFTITAANLGQFTLDNYHELVQELSKINKDNIEDELTQLPVYYSYYHGLMIRAKRSLDRQQVEFDHWCGNAKSAFRTAYPSKVTVALADEHIQKNETYKEHRLKLVDLEEVYGLMKSVCLTLEHKKDMLVQLSANKRMEIKLHA